jgi:hypothetical protein
MNEIRRRETAQLPLRVRRRRKPAQAAAHDRMMSLSLQLRRHVRPPAFETGADIADARFVAPAMAAPAEAPKRQRFAVEVADGGKGSSRCAACSSGVSRLLKRPRLLDFLRRFVMV